MQLQASLWLPVLKLLKQQKLKSGLLKDSMHLSIGCAPIEVLALAA